MQSPMAMINPVLATSSVHHSIDDICNEIDSQIDVDFVPTVSDTDFLLLNMSGQSFKLSNSAAARLPTSSLLYQMAFGKESILHHLQTTTYCLLPDTQEYFFDRSPHLFEFILAYCYTGRLHCPEPDMVRVLLKELHFWGLEGVSIEKCCKPSSMENCQDDREKREMDDWGEERGNVGKVAPGNGRLRSIVSLRNQMSRDKVRCRVSRPCCAKVFTSLSIFFLVLSILNLIVSTEPSFNSTACWFIPPTDPSALLDPLVLEKLDQLRHLISNESLDDDGVWFFNSTDVWFESFRNLRRMLATEGRGRAPTRGRKGAKKRPELWSDSSDNCTERQRKSLQTSCINSDFIFDVIECVCMAWFTFEYFVRFVAVRCRLTFLKDALNIIDMLATIPFFVEIALDSVTFVCYQYDKVDSFLAALKVLRVFRVIKLARYFRSLRVFGQTLAGSKRELVTITMFTSVTVVIFSTLIYYVEKDDPNTLYVSIPAAFYWSIVTMTTCGYGDMYPRTVGGKIIGAVACVSGILILAFPVSILTEHFMKTYKNESPPLAMVTRRIQVECSLRSDTHSVTNGRPVGRKVSVGKYINPRMTGELISAAGSYCLEVVHEEPPQDSVSEAISKL